VEEMWIPCGRAGDVFGVALTRGRLGSQVDAVPVARSGSEDTEAGLST
jgi:hypothetical protein